jgi:hypothetical protein
MKSREPIRFVRPFRVEFSVRTVRSKLVLNSLVDDAPSVFKYVSVSSNGSNIVKQDRNEHNIFYTRCFSIL